ncbi:methyl-accepting chemotaxis protein [Falsiroseomonas stagni]|uniref:Methyl-accepting chemotaxis protein n=1 Tax=Falsiroseomonas stagni DSM 19981 TaxID=1123062 RepID=A0A1I4B2I9_9PROT|nr:methyl-accepting chemotaxis protein [Falsiroseomonas stagni]SFK62099.1 Methyl-accepting chemotaxis protein [Falsiroseomonas stagni DSM 19981]
MRRLTLTGLLYLLAAVSLLGVAITALPLGARVVATWQDTEALTRLEPLSAASSRLLANIPVEATAVLPVLGNGSAEALAAHARAARETDDAMAALREQAGAVEAISPPAREALDAILALAPRLTAFRAAVVARTAAPADSAAVFVPLSESVLSFAGKMAIATTDAELTRIGLAIHALMHLQNAVNMERGGGLRMLGSATPPPPALAQLQRGQVLQDVYRERLRSLGSPTLNRRMAEIDASPVQAELRARRAALQAGHGATMAPPAWLEPFAAQSALLAEAMVAARAEMSAAVEARRDAARRQAMLLVGGGGVILAILLLMTHRILRIVSGIVDDMAESLRSLGEGRFDVAIAGTERRDALGLIARSATQMRDSLAEARRLQEAQKTEALAREERATRVADHVRGFQETIGTLVRTVSEASTTLAETARGMNIGAKRLDGQSDQVAQSAGSADANVQSVAAATEELTASVQEISRQLSRSTQVTTQAVEETRRSEGLVGSLADTAQRIGDVLGLISSIAGQTNLLALNATIEAARAGDAGKGFAVVASEVKALAGQTAKATEEIGAQITQIQGATQEVVEAFRSVSAVIEEVNGIAAAIAAAVEEQGAATQEIARSIQQAASSTRDVSGTILQVRESAAGSGEAASRVLGAAEVLANQATTLSREVGTFVDRVKAA